MAAPTKAKVLRGVCVRGKGHPPDTILPIVALPKNQDEISGQEYAELKMSHYVEAHQDVVAQAVAVVTAVASPKQAPTQAKKE